MKKYFFLTTILFLVTATPTYAAITSASQLSDKCTSLPASRDNCTAEENAFLDGQTATQNSSITNQGQGAQINNQGVNATANPATQIPATQAPTAPVQPAANGPCPNGQAQRKITVNGQQVVAGCDLGYTPLEPIPGVTQGDNGTNLDFPTLLGRVYRIAIIIGALFSVLMLTLSGVRYMLSDVVTDKAKAIQRIKACLYGLVLIAASWLILNTINPQLVTFNLTPGTVGSQIPGGSTIGGGNSSGQSNLIVNNTFTGNLQTDTNICTNRGGSIKILSTNPDGSPYYQCIVP